MFVVDFGTITNSHDPWFELQKLKSKHPELKVTVFAIPGLCSEDVLAKYRGVSWIELGVQGYHGASAECSVWGYEEAKAKLLELEEHFPDKVFRATGFVGSDGLYAAAEEFGWTVHDSINQLKVWRGTGAKRYYSNDSTPLIKHDEDLPSSDSCFVSEAVVAPLEGYELITLGQSNAAIREVSRIFGGLIPFSDFPTDRKHIWAWWWQVEQMPGALNKEDFLFAHHITGTDRSLEIYQYAVSIGAKFLVPCEATRTVLEKLGAKEIYTVPYLAEDDVALPKSDKFRIGIMGQDVPNKGFDEVRKEAVALGIELVDWAKDGIDWSRSKDDFFTQVGAVVCNSKVEGGPMPAIEGLARGRAAITTRVGMMADIKSDGIFYTQTGLGLAIKRAHEFWKSQPDSTESLLPDWVSDLGVRIKTLEEAGIL